MIFNTLFWDKLPLYFAESDTYKDGNNRGLLERYLQIFGLELDESIKPYILNYLNQVDPNTANSESLSHIAYTLGSPLDIFANDTKQFAQLLLNITTLYKIKGTIRSYELFFKLLGLDVKVVEHFDNVEVYYDSGFVYDADIEIFYDSICDTCSEYSLFFKRYNSGCLGSLVVGQPIILDSNDWVLVKLTQSFTALVMHNASVFGLPVSALQSGVLQTNQLYRITLSIEDYLNVTNIKIIAGDNFINTGVLSSGVFQFELNSGGTQDFTLEVGISSSINDLKVNVAIEPLIPFEYAPVITNDLSIAIEKIICFLEPIDSKLRDLAELVSICENISPINEEEITIDLIQTISYDNGTPFDDSDDYDTDDIIATYTYTQP